jgi:hypothetical protein
MTNTSSTGGGPAQTLAFDWIPAALGDLGKKQFEAAVAMQNELLSTFEQMNRAWLARAQSEVDLANEFVSKLGGTRSIPEAAAACQECIGRQLDMFAEDGRRMLADGEKILRASARLFANGAPAASA